MLTNFHAVSFDADDVARVAQFWSAAADMELQSRGSPWFAALVPRHESTPRLIVVKVPEGKTVKNRVHIEFAVVDLAAERDRIVELGGSFVAEHEWDGNRWFVMQDVEGNEFCLLEESS